ncbi:MAG TPA: SDR family oxidoreductase [Tepidisphaeraceae bacterium]|nr:SDR family oxidoreductase [Tepidisphaeraceae bacterium]
MKIIVIGGSGLIGSRLCKKLADRGQDVLAASPKSGVNSVTGEGLSRAITGAQVVVDVSNAPSWDDSAVMKFFDTSTRNLLAAEAKAGARHHVALSVVGTDRLQESGYFRAKLDQEKLIAASGIPYTIVRATQFFEFMGGIAQASTDGNVVRLPAALMQPMAADDVAAAMADYALGPPLNRIVEIAGPEVMGVDEAVRRFLSATGDPRQVITDANAPYYGIQVSERALLPDHAARPGPTRFDDWLDQHAHSETVIA